MLTITVKDTIGAEHGTIELDEATFGIEPNVPVMHQVVTAQLAARRAGTQSTKTRAEVRGGGAKPWKQKGTGRARQGSIRSPQWKGGGVALGPKPRSYAQRTPKKMIKLALRSALSDRAAEGQIIVLDQWGFDAPSTKSAAAVLGALGLTGRTCRVCTSSSRASSMPTTSCAPTTSSSPATPCRARRPTSPRPPSRSSRPPSRSSNLTLRLPMLEAAPI
jgi:large subunit ribosomal protein L4